MLYRPPLTNGTAVTEQEQGTAACLLIHGLNGTPYDMQDLAVEIERLGVHTHTLLLPGHDVTPRNARHFGWDDWAAEAEQALEQLAASYDRLFVIGHSMGGALALHLAEHDLRVSGIMTLCAPAEMHLGLYAFLRHGHRFIPYVPKVFEDIRDHRERWHYMFRRNLWYVPTWPIYSLLHALPQLRRDLGLVRCPALIMAARNDHVVPAKDGRYIFEHISSSRKVFVMLNHSWHVVTRDLERDVVTAEVLAFLQQFGDPRAATAVKTDAVSP